MAPLPAASVYTGERVRGGITPGQTLSTISAGGELAVRHAAPVDWRGAPAERAARTRSRGCNLFERRKDPAWVLRRGGGRSHAGAHDG